MQIFFSTQKKFRNAVFSKIKLQPTPQKPRTGQQSSGLNFLKFRKNGLI